MLTGSTPDAGTSVVAKGQVLKQVNYILDVEAFAPGPGTFKSPTAIPIPTQGVHVRGMASIRVQVYHYGSYNDGLNGLGGANWAPRPWISWRVVGYGPSSTIVTDTGAIDTYVPLTTPQLTSINNPVVLQIRPGGIYFLGIEFDTSGGVDAVNQGFDRVLVNISASG